MVNPVLALCMCLLVRALMMGRLRNSLNSTRAIRQLTMFSVGPFLCTRDTALIGAHGNDDNSKSNSGSVYVFKAPPPPPPPSPPLFAAAIIPHVSRGIRDATKIVRERCGSSTIGSIPFLYMATRR